MTIFYGVYVGTKIVTTNKLYWFLKRHSTGRVHAPGCFKELDELAEKFVNESANRQNILKEAAEFIDNIETEEVNDLNLQLTSTF